LYKCVHNIYYLPLTITVILHFYHDRNRSVITAVTQNQMSKYTTLFLSFYLTYSLWKTVCIFSINLQTHNLYMVCCYKSEISACNVYTWEKR